MRPYSHSAGSPHSALRGQELSLCVSAALRLFRLWPTSARVQVLEPGMRAFTRAWTCAPECAKPTSEHNWWQQCKNRGNAASQWEHRVPDGNPFIRLLPTLTSPPPPTRLITGAQAAILILISLSVSGPLPERGERSPGLWNAPPFSSGHSGRARQRRLEENRERKLKRGTENKRRRGN